MNIDSAKESIRELQSQIYIVASEIGDLIQQEKLIQAGIKKNDLFKIADQLGEIQNQMISCPTVIESNKTITDLGITQITSSQAYITFNIDPPVDVQVEINDGTGFEDLANTGVFPSHNYAIHNQTTLAAETSYTIRLTAEGQEPCTIEFATLASTGLLAFNTHELTDGDNIDNMSDKGNGETLVTFDALGNYGIDPKLDLDPAENEAWFAYDIELPLDWAPTSNVKGPGFASPDTGSVEGGQGGQGSGDDKAFSMRTLFQKPGTAFTAHGIAYEGYHDLSSNSPFGETMWWGNGGAGATSPQPEAALTLGQKSEIKHYIKLNTVGQNDGIIRGYLDGVLQFERTNLGFTDDDSGTDGDPDAHKLAIWMNFFIGGSADTSGNSNDLCVSNERYNYGSVDLT